MFLMLCFFFAQLSHSPSSDNFAYLLTEVRQVLHLLFCAGGFSGDYEDQWGRGRACRILCRGTFGLPRSCLNDSFSFWEDARVRFDSAGISWRQRGISCANHCGLQYPACQVRLWTSWIRSWIDLYEASCSLQPISLHWKAESRKLVSEVCCHPYLLRVQSISFRADFQDSQNLSFCRLLCMSTCLSV